MKTSLRQIVIWRIVSVGLLFSSGCHVAPNSELGQFIKLVKGSNKKSGFHDREIHSILGRGIADNFYYDKRLTEIEGQIRDNVSTEKLGNYAERSDNLDDLEASLDSLRTGVINPSKCLLKEYRRIENEKSDETEKRNEEIRKVNERYEDNRK